jgi:hypothetical protein
MTQGPQESGEGRPAPGSHDRSTPTGSLETSSANLFEVMVAARDSQAAGGSDLTSLNAFYRTLMSGTVLLPVPPDHGEEARDALASAVDDDQEVEISVMLARDSAGEPVNVLFGSIAALAAWSPLGTANLPLPARIAFANLASNGLPAILDPAGPVPYEFEAAEVTALAAGQDPQTGAPLFEPSARTSLRLRLAGPESLVLEGRIAEALRGGPVEEAYLVESETDDGAHLLLGLVGGEGASATVDVPAGTDLVWLEEPLLSNVRRVARPFYRRGRP